MTQRQLTDAERDAVYTQTCHAITAVGAANEALFLARLAVLLMEEIGEASRVRTMIHAAQEGFSDNSVSGPKVGEF